MMAKKHTDAYKKLGRVLIVLFVVAVICAGGYALMDQSIKAQVEENERLAAAENAQLEAQYQQAKQEEQQKAQQGESIQWPEPAQQGWDVLDLTGYPVVSPITVSATRRDLLLGGMLLLNTWHSMPSDFPEDELVNVYDKQSHPIPVSSASVRMLPVAVTALNEMLEAAKAEGLEGYVIDEGYRTMEKQTEYYNAEAAKYSDRYSGDALIERVRKIVNYPGTSEYQSGFSCRVDRYSKTDTDLMNKKFFETEQSDWLVENSWKYGFVFRFPVQGYPNATVVDKSYKTGESRKLSIYRYVGKGHAAVMQTMNFCMEEYIEYLVQHPHLAVYENGVKKYEITRVSGGVTAADVQVEISSQAKNYVVSTDNMGGIITCMEF